MFNLRRGSTPCRRPPRGLFRGSRCSCNPCSRMNRECRVCPVQYRESCPRAFPGGFFLLLHGLKHHRDLQSTFVSSSPHPCQRTMSKQEGVSGSELTSWLTTRPDSIGYCNTCEQVLTNFARYGRYVYPCACASDSELFVSSSPLAYP